ncbi:uncharacterized protein [Channa argus]|uniref:uncharacterized protein isoform X2 n=1 Tax=Channa argus TaxID=215402 RepID=UPI00351FA74D
MDLRTVVIITALLLKTADAFNSIPTSVPEQNQTNDCICNNTNTGATAAPTPCTAPTSNHPLPVLGFLTITWTSACKGDVILYHPSNSSHVCHDSETQIKARLTKLCQQKKGCKGTERWVKGKNEPNGSVITESGAEQRPSCYTLKVQCTVEGGVDLEQQLRTYKVFTGLLCCVLVIIFLIRFTRPTLEALQRRLSDRRQNRWIGPTQSHSGLERLTVSDSREPSSNRNSGFNF